MRTKLVFGLAAAIAIILPQIATACSVLGGLRPTAESVIAEGKAILRVRILDASEARRPEPGIDTVRKCRGPDGGWYPEPEARKLSAEALSEEDNGVTRLRARNLLCRPPPFQGPVPSALLRSYRAEIVDAVNRNGDSDIVLEAWELSNCSVRVRLEIGRQMILVSGPGDMVLQLPSAFDVAEPAEGWDRFFERHAQ